ncbi:MAG: aspartate kinase [Dehalococcoidia bacterium]
MALIVQKYGGSSLSDSRRITGVAKRIVASVQEGHRVVVVVSAMGDTTDELIELAHQITGEPDPRELDVLLSTGETVSSTLLAMALRRLGHEAISLSGAQAGIRTDSAYSHARILSVEADRVLEELDQGKVVIVAGFQGTAPDMDITTLGRGGSDTTAVALAATIKADQCEIYTDVPGVFTADPRLVPDAVKLNDIGFEEMLELASYGTVVVHPRAVELGAAFNIPILVASSFDDQPGTLIHGGEPLEVRNKISSIAHDTDVAKITLLGVPDRPGIAAAIFEPLADAGVSVDTIVQNASVDRVTDLTLTVSRSDLRKAEELVRSIAESLGSRGYVSDSELAKVSIVGTGMLNAPGYAARMFRALYDAGINIELITTSDIRITCIVARAKVKAAVQSLHDAFVLEKVEN